MMMMMTRNKGDEREENHDVTQHKYIIISFISFIPFVFLFCAEMAISMDVLEMLHNWYEHMLRPSGMQNFILLL